MENSRASESLKNRRIKNKKFCLNFLVYILNVYKKTKIQYFVDFLHISKQYGLSEN